MTNLEVTNLAKVRFEDMFRYSSTYYDGSSTRIDELATAAGDLGATAAGGDWICGVDDSYCSLRMGNEDSNSVSCPFCKT